MNKFDKPHRIQQTIDSKKSIELFSLISKLDTYEIQQFSLINQISLDVTNEMGDSLIHEVINIDSRKASEHAKLNVIKFLFANNVDPDKPNKNNQTPLHLACNQQLKLIVDYLLDIKVNVNYQDNLGYTPLHYLLSGKNKTIDNNDVTDFITHPKKVDTKLKEKTIELKKDIWRLIQENQVLLNPSIKNVLPMLKTIEETINGIIIEDVQINELQINTKNLITTLATQKELEDNIPQIKDNINENKNAIKKKINDLFQNFRNLDDLIIHQKTETSWSPIESSSDVSLIRDGKIKKVIKKDIESSKNNIDTLQRIFTLINKFPDRWNENGWEQIVHLFYIEQINRKQLFNWNITNFQLFTIPVVGEPPRYKLNNVLKQNVINDIHDTFKHPLALDYASSIIDFNKLKYVGGPRNVEIVLPNPNYIQDLNILLNNGFDESQQILYLLGSPLQIGTIQNNGFQNYDLFNGNNLVNFWNEPEFNNPNNYFIQVPPAPIDQRQQNDMKWFVILAYLAIMRPNDFEKLEQKICEKVVETVNADTVNARNIIANHVEPYFNIFDNLLDDYVPYEAAPTLAGLNPLDRRNVVTTALDYERDFRVTSVQKAEAAFRNFRQLNGFTEQNASAAISAAASIPSITAYVADHVATEAAAAAAAAGGGAPPPDVYAIIEAMISFGTDFPQKWCRCYKEKKDIGSWLISMWCDLMCKFSVSNLECQIPFRLLALSAGLNLGSNKIQGVINVYKPHLIDLIQPPPPPPPALPPAHRNADIISRWITILLIDNINYANLNNILNGAVFVNPNPNPNLTYITRLIYNYILDQNYVPDGTTPIGIYYYNNVRSGTVIENICYIILDFYNNLRNKPLKQTILDTIYWLMHYDHTQNTFDNNFYLIKTDNIFPLTELKSPSGVSLYNKMNIETENKRVNIINLHEINNRHFQMAHILGLYYEGIFEPVDFKPEFYINNGNQNRNQRRDYSFTDEQGGGGGGGGHEIEHHLIQYGPAPGIFGNILEEHNLELPLKYVWLTIGHTLTPLSKYHYYDTYNRDYISPTVHSYAHMLLKNIHNLQMNISDLLKEVTSIVADLINSKTTRLKKLYTKIFHEIVYKSKILTSYKQSFDDFNQLVGNNQIMTVLNLRQRYNLINDYNYNSLANYLNEINASFYIYYYIYSPTILVKLSRFNYYQIPINNLPDKNLYYNTNIELVDITNEEILTRAQQQGIQSINEQLSKGSIREFSFGMYNTILTEFINRLPINEKLIDNYFITLKRSKVPPSLLNHLVKFYKYVLVELIKRILNNIKPNIPTPPFPGLIPLQHTIWLNAESIIKSKGLLVQNYELSTYLFISKIIEELVKEQIDVYVNNAMNRNFNQIISGINIPLVPLGLQTDIIFNTKQININLDSTSVNTLGLSIVRQFKNMYSIVLNPNKNDNIYVLYPNDLTNINKLRSKNGLEVNEEIITSMYNKGASPYVLAMDGSSPIYPIIKNYNWRVIHILKNIFNMDFRDSYDKDDSQNNQITFIRTENLNNLKKVLGTYEFNKPVKLVLSNIDEFLYSDVEMSIKSNQSFGNNILSNLKYSFNLSTYLTLQILSENLLNISNTFSFDNLDKITRTINININYIKSNYWEQIINSINVPNNFNVIIIRQILDEKIKERNKMVLEINILTDTINQLINNGLVVLANQYQNDPKFVQLNAQIIAINNEINNLNRFVNGIRLNIIPNDTTIMNPIDRYDNNFDYRNIGIHFEVWKNILDNQINLNNVKNFNLIPIYIFDQQYKLINNFNLLNKAELELIEKTMEHWAKFAEDYFSNPKYINQNVGLEYANKMLNYLTKMTIGNSIELIMRKILFTNYMNSSNNINNINDINTANRRVDFILEHELLKDSDGNNISLLGYLYKEICPKLVKNATEIFEDKEEEAGFELQPIRDILLGYFSFLELIPLTEDIINNFKKEVTNYFDTITSKTILLWYVNFENILKFIINNHRCLKTFLLMI